MSVMKIGLLGGTFNPIHLAHLRIAEEVREACGLHKVMFIPAASPPHKVTVVDSSFRDRFAMTKLAIENNPAFSATDLENCRVGKSYSVDTLTLLQRKNPNAQHYFIVGMDSFLEIETWKDYLRLFELCNIVVVSRPGFSPSHTMEALLPVAIKDDFCYDQKSAKFTHKSGHLLIFLKGTFLDISSTRIRQLAGKKLSIKYLVTTAVESYIHEHGLYLNN